MKTIVATLALLCLMQYANGQAIFRFGNGLNLSGGVLYAQIDGSFIFTVTQCLNGCTNDAVCVAVTYDTTAQTCTRHTAANGCAGSTFVACATCGTYLKTDNTAAANPICGTPNFPATMTPVPLMLTHIGMRIFGGTQQPTISTPLDCMTQCLLLTTCHAFDFDSNGDTCWFHGPATACLARTAKASCIHYQRFACPIDLTTTTTTTLSTATPTTATPATAATTTVNNNVNFANLLAIKYLLHRFNRPVARPPTVVYRYHPRPAPTYQHRPAPTYQHRPTPTYQHRPAPTYQHRPAPTYQRRPAPTYQHRPAPTYQHRPAPTYQHRPAPSNTYSSNNHGCTHGSYSAGHTAQQFRQCSNGIWESHNCSPGTIWNQALLNCARRSAPGRYGRK